MRSFFLLGLMVLGTTLAAPIDADVVRALAAREAEAATLDLTDAALYKRDEAPEAGMVIFSRS
jgi:hypothetical protein